MCLSVYCLFCCSVTYRFSHYYSACAIAGQHDGHLPFWLPAFVKLIFVTLHVLLDGDINILMYNVTRQWRTQEARESFMYNSRMQNCIYVLLDLLSVKFGYFFMFLARWYYLCNWLYLYVLSCDFQVVWQTLTESAPYKWTHLLTCYICVVVLSLFTFLFMYVCACTFVHAFVYNASWTTVCVYFMYDLHDNANAT